MLKRLKNIVSATSNKNILTLFSGNVIAQVIPFLVAPWVARIYSPKELGVFTLIFSFITVLATISNGRYEMAIVVPKEYKKVFSLVFLGIIIAASLSLILLPISTIFKSEIAILLKNPILEDYLVFIPIIILLIGVYTPLKYFFTREGDFKILTYSQISKSVSQSILQVSLGLLKMKETGLIWGYLISQLFGNTTILRSFIKRLKSSREFSEVTVNSVKEVAYEFRDFPKYSVWGIFMNNIAQNITIFYIASLYGNDNLGYYSFMQRYINAPLFLISATIGQVYIQELAKNFRQEKNGLNVFFSYLKKLGFLSLIIVVGLYLFLGYFVNVLFSEKWLESARITMIMLPLFFIRFIVNPLTLTNSVYQRLKLSFFLQLGILVFTVMPIFMAIYLKLDMKSFLITQTALLSVYYGLLIFVYYRIIKDHHLKTEK